MLTFKNQPLNLERFFCALFSPLIPVINSPALWNIWQLCETWILSPKQTQKIQIFVIKQRQFFKQKNHKKSQQKNRLKSHKQKKNQREETTKKTKKKTKK